MPKITIWKLFLIACITGFAAAGVSSGLSERVSILGHANDAAVAPRAALPMCPLVQSQMSRPVDAIYQRYRGYTPMTRVAVR